MWKSLISMFIATLVCLNAFGWEITIDILDEKKKDVEEAFSVIYPIPTDSEVSDPNAIPRPLFTREEWVEECARRFVVEVEARYRQFNEQKKIKYSPDNSIAKIKK